MTEVVSRHHDFRVTPLQMAIAGVGIIPLYAYRPPMATLFRPILNRLISGTTNARTGGSCSRFAEFELVQVNIGQNLDSVDSTSKEIGGPSQIRNNKSHEGWQPRQNAPLYISSTHSAMRRRSAGACGRWLPSPVSNRNRIVEQPGFRMARILVRILSRRANPDDISVSSSYRNNGHQRGHNV